MSKKPTTYFDGEGAKAEKARAPTEKDKERLQALLDRHDGNLPKCVGRRKTDGKPCRSVRIFWIRKSTTEKEVEKGMNVPQRNKVFRYVLYSTVVSSFAKCFFAPMRMKRFSFSTALKTLHPSKEASTRGSATTTERQSSTFRSSYAR